jgi:hypothetical protein
MTSPDAPVVVTMPWFKIVVGDVVRDPWCAPWRVTAVEPVRTWPGLRVSMVRLIDGHAIDRPRNPDETVDVLVPAIERETVALIRGAFASARVLPERKVR